MGYIYGLSGASNNLVIHTFHIQNSHNCSEEEDDPELRSELEVKAKKVNWNAIHNYIFRTLISLGRISTNNKVV